MTNEIKLERVTPSSPTVARTLQLIEFLAQHSGVRFTEIVTELGIPKSSAHAILSNIENLGYIYKGSDANYRLTSKFFNLSTISKESVNPLDFIRQIAKNHLGTLKNDTGFAVHLATQDNSNVLYLEKIEADNFIRFNTFVGKRSPIHLTAVGKALLSCMSPEELGRILKTLEYRAGSVRSVKNEEQLILHLNDFRKRGFAIETGEEEDGVRCIAVGIPLKTGQPKLSLGIIGLIDQFSEIDNDALVKKLILTARNIADDLNGG